MRLIALCTIIVLLNSCVAKERETKKPNDRLLFFRTRTVMDMDSLIESDSNYHEIYADDFNDGTDTIKFDNGEIYISYLSIVNACADYSGDIHFKDDSLILELINKRDYVCTELRCDRVIFKVKNDENKRFKIKKW